MANKSHVFRNVRLLYPAILQPKSTFAGDGEEYSFVLLLPKDNVEEIERFKRTYNSLVKEEFKTRPTNLRPAFGSPMEKAVFKDGDEKYAATEPEKRPNYEPYQGCYYASMSVNVLEGRIGAVDMDKQELISRDQLPNGAWANVVVECSAYRSPKFGPQFSVRPVLVQVTDTTDPIGPPRMRPEDALGLLDGNSSNADSSDIL